MNRLYHMAILPGVLVLLTGCMATQPVQMGDTGALARQASGSDVEQALEQMRKARTPESLQMSFSMCTTAASAQAQAQAATTGAGTAQRNMAIGLASHVAAMYIPVDFRALSVAAHGAYAANNAAGMEGAAGSTAQLNEQLARCQRAYASKIDTMSRRR